jgi:hypothetical protein
MSLIGKPRWRAHRVKALRTGWLLFRSGAPQRILAFLNSLCAGRPFSSLILVRDDDLGWQSTNRSPLPYHQQYVTVTYWIVAQCDSIDPRHPGPG